MGTRIIAAEAPASLLAMTLLVKSYGNKNYNSEALLAMVLLVKSYGNKNYSSRGDCRIAGYGPACKELWEQELQQPR